MAFAIKADIRDIDATRFVFVSQKTMYGGKKIAVGDTVFVFASENEGGPGLVAQAVVTASKALPRRAGIARQTPRLTMEAQRIATSRRRLGRMELKRFTDWNDGKPETELNFKFYRQATNKIVGLSPEASAFLSRFFPGRRRP